MFRVDAVDPDYRVAGVYLRVEGPTARISNESTLLELKDIHEEPLCGFNVLVDSHRDDAVGTPGRSFVLDLGRTQFCRRLYLRLANLSIAGALKGSLAGPPKCAEKSPWGTALGPNDS
jgi:hypothetical protein